VRGNPNLHRPLHIVVHGDQSKAHRWIQWARNKLDRLQAVQWLGTKSYHPRRGIFVVIQSHAAEKKIIVWTFDCRLYMESGVLDMLEIAPLNERTYRPAQLLFTDTIKADRGANYPNGQLDIVEVTPGTLKAQNRDEGQSKALGCNEEDRIGQLVVRHPLTGKVNTHEDASKPWCEGGEFLDQKRCQVLCPASVFTGLLQLHVQAIYGSKRRDYFSAGQFGLTLTGIEWAPTGWTPYQFSWRAATGLFRGADYSYWLIVLDLDGFRARRLWPSGCGIQLRQWLIANGATLPADRRRQYEAYLLSTLEQDESEALVKLPNTEEAFALYELGNPWYYGVHWNEDGSEGHAVLIRHKPGASFGGADHKWQATHARVSVGEHSDKSLTLAQGRIFVSWGIEEDTQDFTMRNNGDLVWWPNPLGGMEAFVPKPLNTGNEPDIDSDVPMYCYYNAADQLKVTRFRRLTDPEGYENVAQVAPAQDPNNFFIGCNDDYGYQVQESANDNVTYGFYVDDSSVDLRRKELGGYNAFSNEAYITSSGPVSTSTPGPGGPGNEYFECQDSFPGGSEQLASQQWATRGGQFNSTGTFDLEVETLLLIPWYDASAVYLGSLDRWNDDVSGFQFTSEVNARSRRYFDAGGNIIVEGVQAIEPVQWSVPFQDLDDENDIHQSAGNRGDKLNFSGVADIKRLVIHIAGRFGDVEAYASHGGSFPSNFYVPQPLVIGKNIIEPESGEFGTFEWGGWSDFFDPPNFLFNPFRPNFCEMRESVDGAYVADTSPDGSLARVMAGFDYEAISVYLSHVGHS